MNDLHEQAFTNENLLSVHKENNIKVLIWKHAMLYWTDWLCEFCSDWVSQFDRLSMNGAFITCWIFPSQQILSFIRPHTTSQAYFPTYKYTSWRKLTERGSLKILKNKSSLIYVYNVHVQRKQWRYISGKSSFLYGILFHIMRLSQRLKPRPPLC